jgi:hypothetical protein
MATLTVTLGKIIFAHGGSNSVSSWFFLGVDRIPRRVELMFRVQAMVFN